MLSSINQTISLTNSLHHSSLSLCPNIINHRRRTLLFPFRSLKPLKTSIDRKIHSTRASTGSDMAATIPPSEEVAQDFSPFLKIYKDGHIERLVGVDFVPPSLDPDTGVESKDVVISAETGVSARLYVPTRSSGDRKLPLLIYFHGGGFCVETPFCAKYDAAVRAIAAEANVIALSVDYRLAPENPIPTLYDDAWDSVKWAVAHAAGAGPDEWLRARADFRRVYLAGDSAGANIAHNAALRAGTEGLGAEGFELAGIVLVHPYFWGSEPIGGEPREPEKRAMAEGIWRFAYPGTRAGTDDPWMNPAKEPRLARLGCGRVLVCVAQNDGLRDRAWYYKEVLEKSGWVGTVEMLEAEGDDHVFHLSKPACENAVAMVKRIASFVNH